MADVVKDAGFAQGVFNLGVRVFPKRIEIPPQSVVKKEWRLGNAGELLSEFCHIQVKSILSIEEVFGVD